MTHDDLIKQGYTLNRDGSYSHPATLPARLPDSIAQHAPRPALDKIPKGKGARSPRIALRITRRAGRLLDADNLAGGSKPIIDALRYAGIIPDDDPASIEITFCQEKAAKISQGTFIEVTRLPQANANPPPKSLSIQI